MRESKIAVGGVCTLSLYCEGKGLVRPAKRKRKRAKESKRREKYSRERTPSLVSHADPGWSPPVTLAFRVFLCVARPPKQLALWGHSGAKNGKSHRRLLGSCGQRTELMEHIEMIKEDGMKKEEER